MSTTVEVLSNMVYINHNGLEIGMPKEVALELVKHPKLNPQYTEPMKIINCPKCGVSASVSSICSYCGGRCDE